MFWTWTFRTQNVSPPDFLDLDVSDHEVSPKTFWLRTPPAFFDQDIWTWTFRPLTFWTSIFRPQTFWTLMFLIKDVSPPDLLYLNISHPGRFAPGHFGPERFKRPRTFLVLDVSLPDIPELDVSEQDVSPQTFWTWTFRPRTFWIRTFRPLTFWTGRFTPDVLFLNFAPGCSRTGRFRPGRFAP